MTAHRRVFLCLDTAGKTLMLGLYVLEDASDNPICLYRYQEENASHRRHSAALAPAVQAGMNQAGMLFKDLAGLGINIGPGSFTGLRTGLATVRTLAQFLAIPVYAFNTFELIAARFPGERCEIFWDALQDKAYYADLIFSPDPETPFYYSVSPVLTRLSERARIPEEILMQSPHSRRIISKSLSNAFQDTEESNHLDMLEDLGLFTPHQMAQMIRQSGPVFQRDWREILPLYLQEPNITLRQSKPGRLT